MRLLGAVLNMIIRAHADIRGWGAATEARCGRRSPAGVDLLLSEELSLFFWHCSSGAARPDFPFLRVVRG